VEALEKGRRKRGGFVKVLPETATRKVDRRWPGYVLAVMGLAALLLVATSLLRGGSFSPGEDLYAPGLRDIAVSTADTMYPPADVVRLEERPDVVYVYLTVEDLPRGSDLEARVERSGRRSALSWLLPGSGERLEVSDEQEEHLGPSGDGVSGVVKFAVRAESGGALPAGNYTVSIYSANGVTGAGGAAARKHFVIQG
jgi:hypothetical protein